MHLSLLHEDPSDVFGKALNNCRLFNPKLSHYMPPPNLDGIIGTIGKHCRDVQLVGCYNSRFRSLVPTSQLSSLRISFHIRPVFAPVSSIIALSVSVSCSTVPLMQSSWSCNAELFRFCNGFDAMGRQQLSYIPDG